MLDNTKQRYITMKLEITDKEAKLLRGAIHDAIVRVGLKDKEMTKLLIAVDDKIEEQQKEGK